MEKQSNDNFNWRCTAVRAAGLVLLVIAIAGPWTASPDGAPPPGWCSEPFTLIEADRCVRLVPLAEVAAFFAKGFYEMNVQLLQGTLVLAKRGSEYLSILLLVVVLFLLIQPVFSTLLLLVRGRAGRRRYALVAGGLGAVVSVVLLALTCWTDVCAPLWGLWLYAPVAVGMLAVEGFAFRVS